MKRRWKHSPRSIIARFTPRDVLYVASLGYIAGTWIGIHLALV